MSWKSPASSKMDRSMTVSPRIVAQRGEALRGENTPHGRLAREKSESVGISIQDFVMVLSNNKVRGRTRTGARVTSVVIFTSASACSQSNGTGKDCYYMIRLRILQLEKCETMYVCGRVHWVLMNSPAFLFFQDCFCVVLCTTRVSTTILDLLYQTNALNATDEEHSKNSNVSITDEFAYSSGFLLAPKISD
jgi:hypothetical protein